MTASGGQQQSDAVARRGLMLVLSSPSGAGKTTLSRRLLDADPGVELSVSVTTRKQRPGEVEGRDYHFIDAARFEAMIKRGELLEWAHVFGHRYGTPRAPVEAARVRGHDVVINTDVDHAFAQVQSILAAERLKRERQIGLSEFIRRLQAQL